MTYAVRTRLRLFTVLTVLFLLACFGIPGLTTIFGDSPSSDRDLIMATAALVFSICFLVWAFWFTLLIRVNEESRTVTFIYPFRLRFRRVPLDHIVGFRFRYFPSSYLDYKALQLKSADGKKYTISDFETANLRELEAWCIQNLELRKGRGFQEIPPAMQEAELRVSKEFDRRQLKTFRFYLRILALMCLLLTSVLGYTLLKNPENDNTTEGLILLLLAGVGVYSVWKLLRIQKMLNEHA